MKTIFTTLPMEVRNGMTHNTVYIWYLVEKYMLGRKLKRSDWLHFDLREATAFLEKNEVKK